MPAAPAVSDCNMCQIHLLSTAWKLLLHIFRCWSSSSRRRCNAVSLPVNTPTVLKFRRPQEQSLVQQVCPIADFAGNVCLYDAELNVQLLLCAMAFALMACSAAAFAAVSSSFRSAILLFRANQAWQCSERSQTFTTSCTPFGCACRYWETDSESTCSRDKRPYRIELVGVTCDAGLAVARGVWRRLRSANVPVISQDWSRPSRCEYSTGNALAAVGCRPGKWVLSCDLGFTLPDGECDQPLKAGHAACCPPS